MYINYDKCSLNVQLNVMYLNLFTNDEKKENKFPFLSALFTALWAAGDTEDPFGLLG